MSSPRTDNDDGGRSSPSTCRRHTPSAPGFSFALSRAISVPMKVLIIEDDVEAAAYLKKAMDEAGHTADVAHNGDDGYAMADTGTYDALVVDRMLPKRDGLSVISALRAKGDMTPALVLSALGEVDDRVTGLRAGGDDYLTKPFAVEELLARIRVLGRRGNELQDNELNLGPVQISLARHEVSLHGEPVKLSRREFALLRALADRPGQVFSREQLEEKLYTWDDDVSSNTIDVYIHNLRKKLGSGLIKNIRGVGYVLEPGA